MFLPAKEDEMDASSESMRKPVYRSAQGNRRSPEREAMTRIMERVLSSPAGTEPDDRAGKLALLLKQMIDARVAPGSPMLRTYELIGDRWMPLIIVILGQGTFRHSELHRLINLFSESTGASSISQRILTLKLRTLEEYGFVIRTVWPVVPVRTDYTLTDFGRSLLEILGEVIRWSSIHADRLADRPAT